jgi:hypothetical protein
VLLLAACRIDFAGDTATPTASPATPTPIIIVATPTPLADADLLPIDIEEQLITNLYERVGPSVVHVASEIVTVDFFFGPMASEGTGSGLSGTVGHITNYHVIKMPAASKLSSPTRAGGSRSGGRRPAQRPGRAARRSGRHSAATARPGRAETIQSARGAIAVATRSALTGR